MYLRKGHPWNPGYAIPDTVLSEGPRARITPGLKRGTGRNPSVPFFSPGLPRRTVGEKIANPLVEGRAALGNYGSLGSGGYGSLGDTRTRVVNANPGVSTSTVPPPGPVAQALLKQYPSGKLAYKSDGSLISFTATNVGLSSADRTLWSAQSTNIPVYQGFRPFKVVGHMWYTYDGHNLKVFSPSNSIIESAAKAVVELGKDIANGVKSIACKTANSATVGVVAAIAGGPTAGAGVSAVNAACSGGGGGNYVPDTPPPAAGGGNTMLLIGGAALLAFLAFRK